MLTQAKVSFNTYTLIVKKFNDKSDCFYFLLLK